MIDWMLAGPKPIRHVTEEDGKRVLVYAATSTNDLVNADVAREAITDSHRLLCGAGLLRITGHHDPKMRRLERTKLGNQLLRQLHSKGAY